MNRSCNTCDWGVMQCGKQKNYVCKSETFSHWKPKEEKTVEIICSRCGKTTDAIIAGSSGKSSTGESVSECCKKATIIKEMEIKPIFENREDAKKFFNDMFPIDDLHTKWYPLVNSKGETKSCSIDIFLDKICENGYIKKSPLEIARERYYDFIKYARQNKITVLPEEPENYIYEQQKEIERLNQKIEKLEKDC